MSSQPPSRGLRLELQLHLAIPKANPSNPTTIGIRANDGSIENFRLSTDDAILTVQLSTDLSKFRGVSFVELLLDDAIVHGESERPHGNMAIGVRQFRYRVLSN